MSSPSLVAAASPECPWNALEMQYLTWLGAGLIIFGIIGSAANGLLCAGCLLGVGIPGNRVDQGHRLLLLNLSVASLGTLLLAGFPFTGPSSIYGRWIFGNACCQLFAFLRQMFGLAQMLALVLLAVERYWLFYAITKERSRILTLKGIVWAIASCWTISIALAIPPLVHWGRDRRNNAAIPHGNRFIHTTGFAAEQHLQVLAINLLPYGIAVSILLSLISRNYTKYACDSTRTTCELDWHMHGSGQVTYNLSYFLLGIIIPTALICFCLWRAYKVIKLLSIDTSDFMADSLGQYFITKVVAFSAIGMYLSWLPRAILVFWTMVLRDEENIPTGLKIISPMFVEASTIIPLIIYTSLGSHVRQTILGIFKRNTMKSRHGMIRLQMK